MTYVGCIWVGRQMLSLRDRLMLCFNVNGFNNTWARGGALKRFANTSSQSDNNGLVRSNGSTPCEFTRCIKLGRKHVPISLNLNHERWGNQMPTTSRS